MQLTSQLYLLISLFIFHITPFEIRIIELYHCQNPLSFFRSYLLTLKLMKDFKRKQLRHYQLLLRLFNGECMLVANLMHRFQIPLLTQIVLQSLLHYL